MSFTYLAEQHDVKGDCLPVFQCILNFLKAPLQLQIKVIIVQILRIFKVINGFLELSLFL